jgi:hypothetical protein
MRGGMRFPVYLPAAGPARSTRSRPVKTVYSFRKDSKKRVSEVLISNFEAGGRSGK